MNTSLLTGKCALVTGAATGIGRSIARALARAGANVAVTDINEQGALKVSAEIGESALHARVDVLRSDEIEAAIDAAEAKFGKLEIVVANAGVSSMNPVVDLTEEDWDFNMGVNAKGVFLTNQAAVRRFLRAGTKGAVVNLASIAGKVGAPLLAHYSASKFAVIGFTQALAREVAKDGIRVNCVSPGLVKTGMQKREVGWTSELTGVTPEEILANYVERTPLGRLEEPEDVADVVVFLASNQARFITGHAINISGGVLIS